MPKSKWTKNKADLPKEDNFQFSQKPELCKMIIKKAKRSDAGEYELELENEAGKASCPITLKVIGTYTCCLSGHCIDLFNTPQILKTFWLSMVVVLMYYL